MNTLSLRIDENIMIQNKTLPVKAVFYSWSAKILNFQPFLRPQIYETLILEIYKKLRFKAQTYKESICGCITYTFSKLI